MSIINHELPQIDELKQRGTPVEAALADRHLAALMADIGLSAMDVPELEGTVPQPRHHRSWRFKLNKAVQSIIRWEHLLCAGVLLLCCGALVPCVVMLPWQIPHPVC